MPLREEDGRIREQRIRDMEAYADYRNYLSFSMYEQVTDENGTVIRENFVDEMAGRDSGGEGQKLAIARALYKDFCILIMDEATAALDLETEKAVMDSISQLRGRRTLLMVTHHPALADACQEIYRMEGKGFVKVR